MLRKPVTIALASWLVLFSSVASADAPARDLAHAHVIVSADRVMPLVTYESVTTTNPNDNNQSVTVSGVSVAFVTHGSRNTILTIPRFGLDFVVSPGVTLGLSAWVSTTLSESAQIKGQTSSQDLPNTAFWGVAPRLGYMVPASDHIAFWPRVGIEYNKQNDSVVSQNGISQGGGQEYQFSVDVEGAFVFAPVDHFGITLTGYGAIPIVGGRTETISAVSLQLPPIQRSVSSDESQLAVGLTVGLLGSI